MIASNLKTQQGEYMKRTKLIFPAILLLLMLPVSSFAADWENWNDINVSFKLNKNAGFRCYSRTKFYDFPLTDYYTFANRVGISYKILSRFSAFVSYRYDINKKIGYKEYESRYSLQLAYKSKLPGAVNITLSQTTEIRYFSKNTRDHTRYRFRLDLDKKFKTAVDEALVPYIGPEIFYDDIQHRLFRFRLYAGLKFVVKEKFSIRIGYIFQNDNEKPDINIANTGFDFSF
jgi:hypothetical protein